MTATEHRWISRPFAWVLCAGVLLSGSLYVGLHWSPSSYAIVLRELGVEDRGVIAGLPRTDRGDEFSWQTPLLQMTIRSGFQRFDRTPPYFEDLRTLYGMPILDWAIVFKPQFWLFFVAPPATAFSFYHFFLIALFVVGFTLVFIQLGGREVDSLLMALVLFFASYTQYWWNGAANFLFPFFPWIVLAPMLRWPFAVRLVLFYWLMACGLLTYFYPPNAIALGFVALVFWAGARPGLLQWRTLLPLGLTAAAAGATVLFYLWEPIAIVAQTVYPGQRVSGGGGVYFRWWLTQLLPTSHMNHHAPLIPAPNICELSTIGSVYVLAILFFAPWRELVLQSTGAERRRWLWVAAGLLATQAWMTVRLPPWAGYPLLWHLVPPGRMVLAGGLLLVTFAFLIGQARPLRLTIWRTAAFALTLGLGWALFKQTHGIGPGEAFRDWAFAVPVAVAAVLQRMSLVTPPAVNVILLASAVLLGAVSFGTFNPIQSAKPIFQKHQTPVTAELDRRLAAEGRGYLLLPWGSSFFSHSGLPLIALGYPSLAYSTFDPAMDLWTRIYPELPAEKLNRAFNNVGTLGFGDVPEPEWIPIITQAPMAPFVRPGVTVCEVIRPARAAFAPSVGCPVPLASTAERPDSR
ncbi:MAG TPA: hypothetical protein VD833_10120 [Vicinamibacterales bacterium]|nr:hypothetical protein [Vicinamibacterales bacterium]